MSRVGRIQIRCIDRTVVHRRYVASHCYLQVAALQAPSHAAYVCGSSHARFQARCGRPTSVSDQKSNTEVFALILLLDSFPELFIDVAPRHAKFGNMGLWIYASF